MRYFLSKEQKDEMCDLIEDPDGNLKKMLYECKSFEIESDKNVYYGNEPVKLKIKFNFDGEDD